MATETSSSPLTNFSEGATVAFERRLVAGELLPALDPDVDVGRRDLHRIADAADRFRGDDRRAGSREGFIHGVATFGMVQHRPAHAVDRLLGAVAVPIIFSRGNRPDCAFEDLLEFVCDGCDGRPILYLPSLTQSSRYRIMLIPGGALLPAAGPVPASSTLNGIPARLVLPVIMPAAQSKPV